MNTISLVLITNTASIALTVLIGLIVILVLLFILLIKHFASMDEEERKIYEQETSNKIDRKLKPMQCPYDIQGRSCKYYNGATGYLDIDCKDCDWYNNGVRPSKL